MSGYQEKHISTPKGKNTIWRDRASMRARHWGMLELSDEKFKTTTINMAGWHHQLDGREFEWTLGDGDGQGGLACGDSWGRKESDTTEWLNWTEQLVILSIFSCASLPSVYLLWRDICIDLPPIFFFFDWVVWFFWILSCVNCLHILEINPLSVASSANIFSHSEGCLFVLFTVSFAVQKVLNFISFIFISSVYFCYSHYSRRWIKKRSLCDLS